MRFKPYPILTICVLVSLAILIPLGNWQWGKYTLKMRIDDNPVPLESIEGRVVPGSESVVYSYLDGVAGWRRVVALDTGEETVFLPLELLYQIDPPMPCFGEDCPLAGSYASLGLYKTPEGRNALSNKDAPDRGIYYVLDPAILGAALPEPYKSRISGRVFEPEMILLTENGQSKAGQNPFARQRLDEGLPPQRHFGYAITWWGLAIALIGVYLAFHHANGRLRFKKES